MPPHTHMHTAWPSSTHLWHLHTRFTPSAPAPTSYTSSSCISGVALVPVSALQLLLWLQYEHVSGQPPVLILSSVQRWTYRGHGEDDSRAGQFWKAASGCNGIGSVQHSGSTQDARTMDGSLYMRCTCAAWKTRSSSGVLYTSATSSRLGEGGQTQGQGNRPACGLPLSNLGSSNDHIDSYHPCTGPKRSHVQSFLMAPSSAFHLGGWDASFASTVAGCALSSAPVLPKERNKT